VTLLNAEVAQSLEIRTSLYFNSTVCTGNKKMVKNAYVTPSFLALGPD
jgi:hypothetical protein